MGGMREVCARVVWVARPKPGLDGVPEWVTGTQCSARVQGDSQLCPHPSPGGPCRWPCTSDTPSPGLHPGSRSSHPHQSGQRRAEAHLPRFSIRHGSVGAGEKAEREQCVSHTQPQSHVDELGGRGQQGTGKKPGIGQARSPRAPAEQDNSHGPLGCGGPSLGGAPRCKGGRGICSEKAPPCCGSPPAASCVPGPGVKSRSHSNKVWNGR